MAGLFCSRHSARRSMSSTIATSCRDCFPRIGVPEPDSNIHLRLVARTFSLTRDDTAVNTQNRKIIGRWISLAIVASALVVGCFVLYRTNYYPRTDDAEIFANFIGIAPQVDGPLVRLNVQEISLLKRAICSTRSMNAPIDMHWKT